LKERWNIREWADLDNRFGDMINASLDAMRHTKPTADSNRSRWPDSELWQRVRRVAAADLFEMCNWADPDLIKRVEKEAHDRLLAAQMVGVLITRAALHGKHASELQAFATDVGNQLVNDIARRPGRFEQKLALAKGRYDLGCPDCSSL
jgi:hypothetical protein